MTGQDIGKPSKNIISILIGENTFDIFVGPPFDIFTLTSRYSPWYSERRFSNMR